MTDIKFSESSDTAVIALLNSDMRVNARAQFLEIDVKTERLTGNWFLVDMKRDAKTPAFFVKEVPAGTYFLNKVVSSSDVGIVRYTNHKCHGKVSEVFDLREGRVNEVRSGKLSKGDDLPAKELAGILKQWPNISAPVYQAKLVGYVTGNLKVCADRGIDEDVHMPILQKK
ncbi:hypothetical protein GUA87_00470 [Sneathiella sp. P13V-1]|uniref:hypothetical protein n=1 Tax=Sneathiella sp. P13V-1 TaxID=2697366 RepID=UPI00187B5841|nr:hypothetical protein [Sneathiella sp. P13V-1]MBE7635301.1 hypothetical protein [Sneathiella sp. P13V-1]